MNQTYLNRNPTILILMILFYCFIIIISSLSSFNLLVLAEPDLITLAMTFFVSLWLGVEYGTIIGILVDLLMLLYPYGKPGLTVNLNLSFATMFIGGFTEVNARILFLCPFHIIRIGKLSGMCFFCR